MAAAPSDRLQYTPPARAPVLGAGIMWDLVERLAATLWMLRAPFAICALIFGGMAAINEMGSRHAAAAETHACGDQVPGDESAKPVSC